MKTLEFPLSSFARKPGPSLSLASGIAHTTGPKNMARSADFISFDSAAPPSFSACSSSSSSASSSSSSSPSSSFSSTSGGTSDKIHLDVEEGDDYNSDVDIDELSLCINDDSPVQTPLRQSDHVSNSNGKRPADDYPITHGSPDDAKRQRLLSSKALALPETIWADIFSRLPPQQLAQLTRTCRLFKKYLLNQSIWRASRKQWMPEMPKPVFKLKEWEMLALVKGDGCMICRNKIHTRNIYWAFRVRCCTQCFNQNMTKETSLSDVDFPAALLTALPYGFIDASGQWVPSAIGQYMGGGGLTKVYWNADLKSIRERYEEAKAMNAEEEWLKGLETEGAENKIDVIRMESFESRWFSKGKIKGSMSLAKPPAHGISMSNHGVRGNPIRPNWYQVQPNQPIPHSSTPPQLHQFTAPPHLAMLQTQFPLSRQHSHTTPVVFRVQEGPLTPGGSWSGGYVNGQHSLPKKHQHPRGPTARNERSITEAIEVRARRQQEIEARCMKLDPPLPPNVLQHIPAFKASVIIAIPLTEQAWEILLPKLLEQRKEAEEKERMKEQGQQQLQKQLEEKKAFDTLQRELKEKTEKEWEEVQAPVKAKLDYYASEIINLWLARNPANQHPSINKESALRFAPEVLVQVRQRFYDENPYSPQDPNHMIMLDPSSSDGATALKTPTNKRLLLENMKYVFDTKIKPITDQVRKELFLCSGCENNHKLYSFEGVVQHYAAKHTNLMSLGSIIVHWKSDWPPNPPFLLNPVATGSASKHMAHASHHQQFQLNHHPGANSPFGAFNTTHRMDMQMSAQMEISHQTTITNGYPDEGTYVNGMFTTFPVPQQQQRYVPHSSSGQMTQTIKINTPVQNLVPASIPSCQQQSDNHRIQTEEIAVTAREAWFQLNGIKDLPSSVRVHYVIQKVIKAFQAKFSPLVPELHMFIEVLREHNLMKPMRNVNGLQCLACAINPPHSNGSNSSTHPVGRVFTLLSLIQHFEMVHVLRNRSPLKMDWKTQMIKLPEPRVIGMLRDAMGMDEEKLRLLKEVFPVAFNLPLPMRNLGGFAPSPGPFPKPSQSATPSSSIAASSPSPLRNVGLNETSPLSEQASETPKSMTGTPSPSPGQKLIKRELSLEADAMMELGPVIKNESHELSSEPHAPRRAHINAAEKFLERFMREDTCGNDSTAERDMEYEYLEPINEQRKRRKLEDEERVESRSRSPARPITPRSESPPASLIRSRLDDMETNSSVLDEYYRRRSPIREDGLFRVRRRPTSPSESRYSGYLDYLPPRSPRARSPQRGRTDTSFVEERGRMPHPRPHSPHSRSRSPRLRYLAPNLTDHYYDHDFRVGLYPRDSMQYIREYQPLGCDYEERRRGSVGPPPRQSTQIPPDSRYYDHIYEKGWYVDEIISPTRTAGERSRSPLPRGHPLHRDYKYGYMSPVTPHAASYYAYPAVRPQLPPPYLEDSRYAREVRPKSPIYGVDPKRALSINSRHAVNGYHAHSSLPTPLRGQERFNDEEEYSTERRYREITMRDYFDRTGTQNSFDDIPAPRSRVDEDDLRY